MVVVVSPMVVVTRLLSTLTLLGLMVLGPTPMVATLRPLPTAIAITLLSVALAHLPVLSLLRPVWTLLRTPRIRCTTVPGLGWLQFPGSSVPTAALLKNNHPLMTPKLILSVRTARRALLRSMVVAALLAPGLLQGLTSHPACDIWQTALPRCPSILWPPWTQLWKVLSYLNSMCPLL